MNKFWDSIFGLNCELAIWVEEEDLGKDKTIYYKHERYSIKIPQEIREEITLRLKGLGKTRLHKTGDLMLHIWLNKGEDIRTNLWLSETSARNGEKKKLFCGAEVILVTIPPGSYNGLTIRLKGLGRGPNFNRRAPVLIGKKRGNLLVKLFVYPDNITPYYRSFDALSTENMVLEGWVYRKFDEVMHKLGKLSLPAYSLRASKIANLFNEGGWTSIFNVLVDHLRLAHLKIELIKSPSICPPGSCEITVDVQNNMPVGHKYKITIKEQFLDNPFSIAAIMAHELCHVVYSEKIDTTRQPGSFVIKSEKATLEEERTVDLLVFMFKIGEFQLRVARDKRFTLGYFNQEVFERIQVIVSRKLN